jgi:alpha-L-arabinofuranosidase
MKINATIQVSPETIVGRISPYLIGACMEDVNHEVYGGIYSQMLFGESFEEEPQEIDPRLNPAFAGLSGTVSCRAERFYLAGESEVRSWQPFRRGTAEGVFQATVARARRGRRSQKIEFTHGVGEVGIENRGLNRWGLNLLAGEAYGGLVVALAEQDTPLTVALESADGTTVYAEQTMNLPGDRNWHIVTFQLTPAAGDPQARFAIKLKQPGALWVDYALLQPGAWGRFKGTQARRDIGQGLVDQGLTVLRYGGYMINTDWEHEVRCPGSGYRWKKMIGPRENRPPYLGTFYPYNSNGFGLIDYIAFCEAAGFLCVPTINPCETPADVADLVHYLNGDASTPWGKRRAEDGHPAPYGVRYLQIGNEEHTRGADGRMLVRENYPAHFAALLDAAANVDPALTVIMAPWLYNAPELDYPENRARMAALLQVARGRNVLMDVHVGGDNLGDAEIADQFLRKLRAYLNEIDPANQVGFCILEENGVRHDVQRALGHAHHINTIERMGEAVVIDCPANCLQPYLQHDNWWDQGQLFFTPGQAWGMPPFYAQQMIAQHYQPLCVAAAVTQEGDALDVTVTRSEDGQKLVLKAVNLGADDVGVSISGLPWRAGRVRLTRLTGDLTAENTPTEPRKIAPVVEECAWAGGAFECALPGHSFTALQFEAQAS